ncbi:MAG: stalk domain-containing protein [Clostridiales bacterium]|nr:stalk domain-containing protein [Clostridiales bacterium]
MFAASADLPVRIRVDGVLVSSGDAPVIEQGRVMIPLRSVVECLEGKVFWYPEEQQVVGFRGARGFDLIIGATRAYLSDGTAYTLDAPAKIIGGRTYVPLRFVSEAMGCKVEWEEAARTAVITTTPVDIGKELEALTIPTLLQISTDKGKCSGFFFSKSGEVITCADVIKDASWIRAISSTGAEYEAEKMTVDSVFHLAKIRLKWSPGEEFPVFRYFDDFAGVEEGEPVYAFGSGIDTAEGKRFTAGKIWRKEANHEERGGISTYTVTAGITAASKGGPLVKESGALLGVNYYAERDGVAVSYAIPVEYVFSMRNR